jgi:hypothetical protein
VSARDGILAAVVAAAVAGGVAFAMHGDEAPPPAPPPPPPAVDEALVRRVAALEARLEEMAASADRLRKEIEESREADKKTVAELRTEVAKQTEKANAAESLLAGYSGEAHPPEAKTEDLDAMAKAVSKGMRQGIRDEFRKIAEMISNPTPEALDARRRQLKMAALAFGANAGLDQAQTATLERILNDTDERAREDLRPIVGGIDDYRKIDYVKVKKVTDDSFAAQNEQFEKEFPKDKSDRLKRTLEPIRNVFGAMIDELGKQATAPETK